MTEVLIVDDDESLRDSLRKTLEKEGYSVSDAPSGTAGGDLRLRLSRLR